MSPPPPRRRGATVDIATNDRATTSGMIEVDDRRGVAWIIALLHVVFAARSLRIQLAAQVPLFHLPAVILATGGVRRLIHVDLFALVASDVADPEIASESVEREAIRIPEPDRPDLVEDRVVRIGEGIRGRNRVVAVRIGREVVAVRVDADHLSEENVVLLGAAAGVVLRAAVP